jgi:hypothetical protein
MKKHRSRGARPRPGHLIEEACRILRCRVHALAEMAYLVAHPERKTADLREVNAACRRYNLRHTLVQWLRAGVYKLLAQFRTATA